MKNMILAFLCSCLLAMRGIAADRSRPNVLWISCEDTSPWLGFCGEKYARTPNLDALARSGVHYRNAFATAPVCSPSRFAIITGNYATSYGTQRLRSQFAVPDTINGFPALLREAGYYCSNNSKTDYNTSAERRIAAAAWNRSSREAHWRNRPPGQPFFAVFNLEETHQGKIFESTPPPHLNPSERHDPSMAPVPPYYPDTPAARRTMARVHDCITAVDKHAGAILADLERDGLSEDTIVFFWSDHGQGIPRGKRTLWDTGLKIPLVVYFPEKYRHLAPSAPGSVCDRMVSLIDLGPTMLSLLQLPIPESMQGRAFLGQAAAAPREYIFGARDRVDEVDEVSRSVRDGRYLYIHSFMPDASWNQPEVYSDRLELRREISELAAERKLNPAQLAYAGPTKPVDALYDTQNDPWQIRNVAANPELRPVLERLRRALRTWQVESRDLGMIHGSQAGKLVAGGRSLFEVTRSEATYPLERVLDTAWKIGHAGNVEEFIRGLDDADPTVRYWAAIGLRVAGHAAAAARPALTKALIGDESMAVQIEAAGILAAQWNDRESLLRLVGMLADNDRSTALHAARTLEMLGEKVRPVLSALRAALPRIARSDEGDYARWSVINTLNHLSGTNEPIFDPPAPISAPAAAKRAW